MQKTLNDFALFIALNRMVKKWVKVDPKDPFLNRKPTGRSGLGDLSKKHDNYLYGRKRRRGSSSTPAH